MSRLWRRITVIIFSIAAVSLAVPNLAVSQESERLPQYSLGAVPVDPELAETFQKAPKLRAFLPEIVDLTRRLPSPGNQGVQGSCVGWAVAYAAHSYYNGRGENGRNLSRQTISSPAYLYNSLANGCCDCGAKVHLALERLRNYGNKSLAESPYSEHACPVPQRAELAKPVGRKIADWLSISPGDLDLIKQELAFGHPVIATIEVTRSFKRGRGVWNPSATEEIDGYHAITVIGYNDRERYFKIINSWGTQWNDGGYGRISYDGFRQRAYQSYVMRADFEPGPPEPLPTPTPEDFGIELPNLSCGGVIVEREGREFRLTGFAGNQEDVDALQRAIASRDDVKLDVELRPWPQCETLTTLRDVLADARKPEVTFAKSDLNAGDLLSFEVSMADYQGYLHVAYVQADGKVVNLVQSSPLSLRTLSPRERLKFGDGKEGRPKFTVGEPFGEEMVVVVASKSPLFAEKRPGVEVEREFLSALREAIIARPDTSSPERLVTADYYIVTTHGSEN